jgi:hypothetical protein
METININTINFNLTDFIFSLILMLIFLSFLMEGIRFYITDITEMIVPYSTSNETVKVLSYKTPKWLSKLILAVVIIITIIVVRGMFDMPLTFELSPAGYKAMFEMGIAMGFLTLGYTIAGPVIAKGITLRLLKKYKFSGIDVITDEEYMALGRNSAKS